MTLLNIESICTQLGLDINKFTEESMIDYTEKLKENKEMKEEIIKLTLENVELRSKLNVMHEGYFRLVLEKRELEQQIAKGMAV